MFIKASDLTRGEKLRLVRKRGKQTQSQAAKRHKVSVHIYRRWERDDEETTIPSVAVGRLAMHEQCWILRLREDMSLEDVANKIGVCRWWLCQMEQGEAPVERLAEYWKEAA